MTDPRPQGDELALGLELAGGFEVAIDRESIAEGEDWQKRLGVLIADSDTIVFILSPASAESSMRAWEVKEAAHLSKRIIPVQAKPLGKISPPTQLAVLQYVRFDNRSFMKGLNLWDVSSGRKVRSLQLDLPESHQVVGHRSGLKKDKAVYPV